MYPPTFIEGRVNLPVNFPDYPFNFLKRQILIEDQPGDDCADLSSSKSFVTSWEQFYSCWKHPARLSAVHDHFSMNSNGWPQWGIQTVSQNLRP
jgi:hypothetical protein